MFNSIKELFYLLDNKQLKKLYFLQILVVLMAFLEIAGIISIVPFMQLVADPAFVEKSKLFGVLYTYSNASSPNEFLFLIGFFVLFIIFISTIVSVYTTWKLLSYGSQLGMELGDRLYRYYMFQPWLFHASTNSSYLTTKISQDAGRVTSQIILPLLLLNSKVILLAFLLIGLFLFEPYVSFFTFLVFSLVYVILYKFVKKKVYENGLIVTTMGRERFRLMSEGFGGIKDVILTGKQDTFISKFNDTGIQYAKSHSMNLTLGRIPRFFIEFIAIGSFIFLILYLIDSNNGNLSKILPLLSVYALVGLKLLPAIQQVYVHIAAIKGALPSFDAIKKEMFVSKEIEESHQSLDDFKFPEKEITLDNVTFTYPNKKIPALKNISLNIPTNKVIGLVGESGSGKSTTIDILLGLIVSDSGSICIDGSRLEANQMRSWQNHIGYVSQSIFLLDASIAENIAFGLDEKEIDKKKLEQTVVLAHLSELVNELPDGIFSQIGERGVQLSGGQRQRIGIARALYHNADLLVFDEATSALDGITEKLIMDAIHNFSGQKTIVMIAHRLKTVEKCDIIYLFDKGKIVDSGTYDKLIEKNKHFKKMTLYS